MAFRLHFKDDGTKKIQINVYLLPDLLCYILLLSFTFPKPSKCFLSNGTKNMHILASGPELQAVMFEYVILGKNRKKVANP